MNCAKKFKAVKTCLQCEFKIFSRITVGIESELKNAIFPDC
jgi:hypothetical protein